MLCEQIPCGAEALGFLAQVRVGTATKAGTYSFGAYAAGIYRVEYASGAIFNSIFGFAGASADYQNISVIACGGALTIAFPILPPKPTQPLAEALAKGSGVCFSHSGGVISIQYSSQAYNVAINGNPNPTFNLMSMTPSTPSGGGGNETPSGKPVGGGGFGGLPQGCEVALDCGDGSTDDDAISGFSSEEPDRPINPRLPTTISGPTNPFPTGPTDPPLPPALGNVSFNCVTNSDGTTTCVDPGDGSGAFSTLADCNAACASVVIPPPPDPPPPTPPPASYNCDGHGNCIDPGNGTGTYKDSSACYSACTCVGFSLDTVDTNPITYFAPFPFDPSCTQAVSFTGHCFLPGDKLVVDGIEFSPVNIPDANHANITALDAYVICITVGVGNHSCGIGSLLTPRGVVYLPGGINIATCLSCNSTKTFSVCQPSYSGAPCSQSCNTCCTILLALGVGGVSSGWSNVALQTCLGASPPGCFFIDIGHRKFCLTFTHSTPGGASYVNLDFYDVTRIS